jgi:hypothetical protein
MELFPNPGCFGHKKPKEWDFSSSEYQHCQKKLKRRGEVKVSYTSVSPGI